MSTDTKIQSVAGFRVAGVHCGLKKEGKLDFALIVSDTPCTAAGVFTTNYVKAAPVLVDMERLQNHASHIRAVAINTGCANACTGQQGIDNALQTARWVAEAIGCDENEVLVLSTGVIGTQLPMDKIKLGIEMAADSLGNDWEAAARAIMTTDTRPKIAARDVYGARIVGIAKGAGMIAPNMATMLSVVVTDAKAEPSHLQNLLTQAVQHSFNCIVVDGDMSTNDTVLLLANGKGELTVGDVEEEGWAEYWHDLNYVCDDLAHEIVKDAEGVTKFVTISVKRGPKPYWDGEQLQNPAHKIANTIATSPLVKTAFYGNDANWGRIIAAAGRAGFPLNQDKLNLWVMPGHINNWPKDALALVLDGVPTTYSEEQATAIVSLPQFSVILDCGMENGSEARVYTCDLSHEYVSINGDYRS